MSKVILANFPVMRQESVYWCWATSAAAVLQYYNNPAGPTSAAAQRSIVRMVKHIQPNVFDADTDGILLDVQSGLDAWGVSSEWVPAPLSFDDVKREIDSGRPILAGRIPLDGKGTGHVVVIDGYDDGEPQQIHFMDPWIAAGTWVDADVFMRDSEGRYDGNIWGDCLKSVRLSDQRAGAR